MLLQLTAADLEWLLAANPDDNAEAAYWIGHCHYFGTGGVQTNYKMAVWYFEKAAKHNHAKALWYLAYCYQHCLGVTKDETRATQLFQKAHAALQAALPEDPNDAQAQYLLGFSYDCGYGGLNKDKARAFLLYQQAAQQGHLEGQYNVGYCLEYGRGGVTQDCVQAAGWYGQAARQGKSFARTKFDKLLKYNAELKKQLAAVARNGARDQQKTFLAASALADYWTQTNGANSTTAQQWQAIADQCTNKLPPSWKPRILTVAKNPLGKLQAIQKCDDTTARQEKLAAFVKELQVYSCTEVFRVLGYCYDHGIGVEQEDQEQAFRLYVKADKLVGIKPPAVKKKGWFGFRKTNPGTEAATATTATLCSSAEWLYKRLKDERVTCYETRFELDETLAILSAHVARGKKARDSATVEHAIRCKSELEFLQGLLLMDQFTSEAELRAKARELDKQVDRTEDIDVRLPLIKKLERVEAQLTKEVMAREGAELQRRQGAAAASRRPPPPSAPLEEELPPDASVPKSFQ